LRNYIRHTTSIMYSYEGKSKSKETFLKKAHLFKYTKTKLILLLKVIPLNFDAPVPAFQKFYNSVRKKIDCILILHLASFYIAGFSFIRNASQLFLLLTVSPIGVK